MDYFTDLTIRIPNNISDSSSLLFPLFHHPFFRDNHIRFLLLFECYHALRLGCVLAHLDSDFFSQKAKGRLISFFSKFWPDFTLFTTLLKKFIVIWVVFFSVSNRELPLLTQRASKIFKKLKLLSFSISRCGYNLFGILQRCTTSSLVKIKTI